MPVLDGYALAPKVHRDADHRLYFVRLDFEPVFPDVKTLLRSRLLELGAHAAHVYDLIGAHDLLLRIQYTGEIRELIEELRLPDMRRAEFMAVRRQPTYWAEGMSDRRLPTLAHVGELSAALSSPNPNPDLQRFVDLGLVIPIMDRPGVKFFIAVSASIGQSSSINFDDVLLRYVTRVLDDAGDLIFDRSVYSGDGFARLLIMGRLRPERYFDFMNNVVFALSDEYMRELFSARTATSFGTQPNPMIAIEDLESFAQSTHARQRTDSPAVEKLLLAGETQTLEVKASAFLNFDRLVHSNDPDWTEMRPEFVKAVCGLLNQSSPVPSTLLVGAVETARYHKWLTDHDGDLVVVGDYTIVGVEEDQPSGDWDAYQRRVIDALDKAITPSPAPYIRISLEEASVTRHAGTRKVLRLELTPQGRAFYQKSGDKLWVRTGAQVRELRGEDRDKFVLSMRK